MACARAAPGRAASLARAGGPPPPAPRRAAPVAVGAAGAGAQAGGRGTLVTLHAAPPSECVLEAAPQHAGRRRALLASAAALASGGLLAPPLPALAKAASVAPPSGCAAGAGFLQDAEEAYALNQLARASRLFEAAAECLEGDERKRQEALKRLGDVLVDLADLPDAIIAYDEALALAPGRAGAHFGRGRAHEELGQYDLAAKDYFECLRVGGPAPEPLTNLAFDLGKLGRWKEAAECYKRAEVLFLERKEKTLATLALVQYGLAAFELGDDLEAEAVLEVAGRRRANSDLRAALAVVYWSQGKLSKAESMWEGACDMEGARCARYSDQLWVRDVRRWPPRMMKELENFLNLRPSRAEPTPEEVRKEELAVGLGNGYL